jgi:hypothetical protein
MYFSVIGDIQDVESQGQSPEQRRAQEHCQECKYEEYKGILASINHVLPSNECDVSHGCH